MNNTDNGFTLIELLVVIGIIGLLASIAVPVYENSRKKAYDTVAISDLRSIIFSIEEFAIDNTIPVVESAFTGNSVNYNFSSSKDVYCHVDATGATASNEYAVGCAHEKGELAFCFDPRLGFFIGDRDNPGVSC